jgi:DNA-binding LytR/AlgR family response regulator
MADFFFIKDGSATIRIITSDILFIKARGNYAELYMADKNRYTCYKSLKSLLDILPDEFMRVHNSYISNLHYIDKISDNTIYSKSTKIPISASYKECLEQCINRYKI